VVLGRELKVIRSREIISIRVHRHAGDRRRRVHDHGHLIPIEVRDHGVTIRATVGVPGENQVWRQTSVDDLDHLGD
jgi:hypothetical protein